MIRAVPQPRRFAQRMAGLASADVVARVWAGDHTVWDQNPIEIADRLGWLRAPEAMSGHLAPLRGFGETVRNEGCDTVVLLGMGGSILAPETLAKTSPRGREGPALVVLDTTHPTSIERALDRLDPRRAFFLVSTKSGTTTETLSLFRLFYHRAEGVLGRGRAGDRFAAITDPGSPLVQLARQHGFRRIFLNDPAFGGRYAALSLVGLVPAALLGLELEPLLDSARAMSTRCQVTEPLDENPAAVLASLLAAHADDGRDKATFVLPQSIASLGDWIEQLVAESTGKCGTGVVPIVGEPLGPPSAYGDDRVFLCLDPDAAPPQPAVYLEPAKSEELGGQFFLWEMATALLGHLLGVNPFDQPDVEASKSVTRQMLSAYREQGARPSASSVPLTPDTLRQFVGRAVPGDYIAILAYLDANPEVAESLATLRRALRDAAGCATTLGYGPRFLHSTGQLHKGDSGRGLFIELVDEVSDDLQIPDDGGRPVSFGLLLRAQALGDAQALADRGRRLIVSNLAHEVPAMLRDAAAAVRAAPENSRHHATGSDRAASP